MVGSFFIICSFHFIITNYTF